MESSDVPSPAPSGTCWCDCGEATAPGAYFVRGHDKRAQRYLDLIDGQNTAGRIAAAGYTPGRRSLRDAALAAGPHVEACGRTRADGRPCRVVGVGDEIRRHRDTARYHRVV